MDLRRLVLLCLVSYAFGVEFYPSSCRRCTSRDFIPKLPMSTGAVENADNRPYTWAVEAMILTKLNFRILTPPAVGRVCGIVGSCLFEATKVQLGGGGSRGGGRGGRPRRGRGLKQRRRRIPRRPRQPDGFSDFEDDRFGDSDGFSDFEDDRFGDSDGFSDFDSDSGRPRDRDSDRFGDRDSDRFGDRDSDRFDDGDRDRFDERDSTPFDGLTDVIDGAGFWALHRLFSDTQFFDQVYGRYGLFARKSIRDLLPAMRRAAEGGRSSSPPSDRASAVAAGAAACERVIQRVRTQVSSLGRQGVLQYVADGFTPRGDLRGFNPSNYQPSNSPQRLAGITHCDDLEAPGRWQPLCIPNHEANYGSSNCRTQSFIADWAGRYTPFALKRGTERSGRGLVPPPPRYGSREFDRQANEVLKIYGKLGDREKVLAEYWADGPDSTMPAGHLWKIAADAALYEGLSQEETAKLLFVTGVALNDAGVASWRTKTTFDFNRPLQMIQCGPSRGKRRLTWLGPYLGVGLKNISEWRPYQASSFVSPGFAGYTSGHSTFSAAGAEAMRLYFGDDRYRGPDCDIVKEGESLYEPRSSRVPGISTKPNRGPNTPGYTPADDIIFCWDTWTEAAIQSGQSRLYGGIHIRADDTHGQRLGREVARDAYNKAKRSF